MDQVKRYTVFIDCKMQLCYVDSEQGSENHFCKEQNSILGFVSCAISVLATQHCCRAIQPSTVHKRMRLAVCQQNFIYKNRW